jgi:hypothetical protein
MRSIAASRYIGCADGSSVTLSGFGATTALKPDSVRNQAVWRSAKRHVELARRALAQAEALESEAVTAR